ncbi:hypothetical protein C8R44DRAFT_792209 [Mycena epipterygia]|nr:hypothetical protein C8R44DRAFT_792209 [Mycena epipterygia]
MTLQVHRKQTVSVGELDEAVDLCVRAFVGELASNSMVGGDETLKDPIFRAMIRAAELEGEVYFATDSSKVVAVAVWFPPGKSLFNSEEQRALGFDDFIKKLTPETKAFWDNVYGPVVDKFLAEVIGPTGTRDSQYLNLIATDPPCQNKGIATLLLKTVHDNLREKDKKENTNTMLAHCASNQANARFYESCGYTIRGKMDMDAPTGGYPVIVLTK